MLGSSLPPHEVRLEECPPFRKVKKKKKEKFLDPAEGS
jgi:hypothetical protein